MDMKFLINKAKTLFLTFLEDALSEKNSQKKLGDPQSAHFDVVADHRYHSSRSKCGYWDFPNFRNPSNFKHL